MPVSKQGAPAKYSLSAKGIFKIENYNDSKTFSNFFPGVAGLWGIPMWAFYVNRGQCIASFGIQDKDKAILEFQPANKAYRLTSLQGFRTFIKIKDGRKSLYWEPFQKNIPGTHYKSKQTLSMTAHDVTLEEVNEELGLKIKVNYFSIPQEPFSGLVRQVSFKNLKRRNQQLEVLDGLPIINAFGLGDWASKNMSRTAEAWIKVRNLANKAPFYQLNVDLADKSEVTHIKEGNFFFCLDPKSGELSDVIVEAPYIFGERSDYSSAENFLGADFSLPKEQKTDNKTPSAFSFNAYDLKPNASAEFVSLYGYAHRIEELKEIIAKFKRKGYIEAKARENEVIINGIRNFTATKSSHEAFNLYASHTFLDNVLRGGLPISLKTDEGSIAFNVYSRKHGDPERDYNYFNLSPTYFSQGNGNYRDVNQNRRNDLFFNTDVRCDHLHAFMNLVQADGYNPLVVKGTTFSVDMKDELKKLLHEVVEGNRESLDAFFEMPFRPGELMTFLFHKRIKLKIDQKEFLSKTLELCHKHESAEHGEGFWSDHWHYNLDLIESYVSLFPDKIKEVFFDQKDFTFFHSDHYVLPRDERYLLNHRGVRQYASVAQKEDPQSGSVLKTKNGEGSVFKTTLFVKLLCLIANKAATLDPSGVGVEMEADKPNWYDALNGLPGLLGSSVSEAIEIKRFAQYLLDVIKNVDPKGPLAVFEELASFVSGLTNLLALEHDPFSYWQKANDIKEHYRNKVKEGINGNEIQMSIIEIKNFLNHAIKRIDKAMVFAKNSNGFLSTYFYHEVIAYEKLDKTSLEEAFVRPTKFKRHDLPPFLEGYVHALRAAATTEEALGYYKKVKESDLFDKKLKMFKVNESLESASEEIGRCRIFPSGWLENESIWLHMEYKFLLELLRKGLYEEFYENFKEVLIPFQPPARYGRSILENSSFLVSSAHEDPHLHGQGFVARLSGSTAEFLHMWLLMNVGERPFIMDARGELNFQLKPALPGRLFTTKEATIELSTHEHKWESFDVPKNAYAFNLLGGTCVVYHNPKRKDTFGTQGAKVKRVLLTSYLGNKSAEYKTATIPSPLSHDIRERKIKRIDVYLE